MRSSSYDAVVVGSGPNGLAAAISIALAGRSVAVFEARETVGGGMRSGELTLPGFIHDICSTAHPLGVASPFFRTLPLERYGLEWVQPPAPMAHPLPGGAALLERSIERTAAGLGDDATGWRLLMRPLADDWEAIASAFLGPLRPLALASHPFALGRFGAQAVMPASLLARMYFQTDAARALFAGMSAHAM
ncbi:MAG TPA: NAD(P)-binding protein, partial [Ktedonobacterales bacterium]